jgi:hypothetical protein
MQYIRALGTAVVGGWIVGSLFGPPAFAYDSGEPAEHNSAISFGYFESTGFAGVYASLTEENTPELVSEYLDALADVPNLDAEDVGLGHLDDDVARRTLEAAADAALNGDPVPAYEGVEPSDSSDAGTGFSTMSVSTAPVLGYPTNSRYSWRFDDVYTQRYCDEVLLPWTCSDSTLSLRFVTDPGNRGSRTSINFLEGGQGRVTSFTLRSIVYSGGSNISDVTKRWNTPGSGVQWNTPHSAAAGKTFQVWFKMTIYHTKGGPVTAEWKTAKSATCRTPTASVAFRCLFPA